MHHLLAGSRIRLTYLRDRRVVREIDWAGVHDDLADAGMPMNYWRWCDLDALTHVVLATDRETGRYSGVLGLVERGTPTEPWLLIETALVRPGDDSTLLRSMLAHVLARVVCLEGKPAAVAAPRANEAALRDLFPAIRCAASHPPDEGNVIAFQTAWLARRIGGDRVVLDLRPVLEGSLLRDLRGLHGVRRERAKTAVPMEKAARTGGATRRPRKATHIDKTG